ncbi:hypothetical protein O181_033881 [Austropuccinia psidii MF-1]|uniref:Uncharacterized protein n=1 Tax=Austropuccinia psidii MF-1 TaxID=1389203 RepID=A0A9Q3D5A0_9BASI|nr:hypothetical protein [Austropuccinia psidii MF-1]
MFSHQLQKLHDGTPAAPQLRAQLDGGPILEGAAPSRKEGRGPKNQVHCPGEDDQEEVTDGTEDVPAPVGESQGTGGPTLAIYNKSEPSLLAIMQQMTQIMANIQAASSSEASRPPAFKALSMKAQECFDGT